MAKYFIIFFSALLVVGECAPKRSKKGDNTGPHTIYDQQQTGDYNIQVHLKDFQIIAVLGDDLSSGDYDYTYDYSDFTNKPSSSPKPTEASISVSTSSSTEPTNTSTTSGSPYPFVNSNLTSSEATKPELINNVLIGTFVPTEKPDDLEEKPASTVQPADSDKPVDLIAETPVSAETLVLDSENVEQLVSKNASTTQKSPKLEDAGSPGKIKVQIIETPVRMSEVPGEDLEQNETLPTGDILHIRKCATGFNRDKRGRCRRVRRPATVQSQIPFGFSRLASNLASRFRQSSEDSSISSSESKEN